MAAPQPIRPLEEGLEILFDPEEGLEILSGPEEGLEILPRPWSLTESLSEKWRSLQGSLLGIMGAPVAAMRGFGKMTGWEGLEEAGKKGMEAFHQRIENVRPPVTRYEDIRSADDLFDFGIFAVGQVAGSLGLAAGGAAGGGLAGAGVGALVGGPAGVAPGTAIGTVAGGLGAIYLMNVGDLYETMLEKGVDAPTAAALAGIPVSVLDSALPARIFGKLAGKAMTTTLREAAEKGIIRRAAREAATSAGIEGVTEGLQEGLSMAAEAAVGAKVTLPEILSRTTNAFVIGALGGGAAGAVTGAVERAPKELITEPPGAVEDLSLRPVTQTVPGPNPEDLLALFERVEQGVEPELQTREARLARSQQKQEELAQEYERLEQARMAREIAAAGPAQVALETIPPPAPTELLGEEELKKRFHVLSDTSTPEGRARNVEWLELLPRLSGEGPSIPVYEHAGYVGPQLAGQVVQRPETVRRVALAVEESTRSVFTQVFGSAEGLASVVHMESPDWRGAYIPVQQAGGPRQTVIAVDPVTRVLNLQSGLPLSPHQAAGSVGQTILHEVAHELKHREGIGFLDAFQRVQDAVGIKGWEELYNSLRSVYADEQGNLVPELIAAREERIAAWERAGYVEPGWGGTRRVGGPGAVAGRPEGVARGVQPSVPGAVQGAPQAPGMAVSAEVTPEAFEASTGILPDILLGQVPEEAVPTKLWTNEELYHVAGGKYFPWATPEYRAAAARWVHGLPSMHTEAEGAIHLLNPTWTDGEVKATKAMARAVRQVFNTVFGSTERLKGVILYNSVSSDAGGAAFAMPGGVAVAVNPLVEVGRTPEAWARNTMLTVEHEVAHALEEQWISEGKGKGPLTYLDALAEVFKRVGPDLYERTVDDLRRVYDDGSGKLAPEVVSASEEAARVISRGRAGLLGRTREGREIRLTPDFGDTGVPFGGVRPSVPGAVQGAAPEFDWESFYRGKEESLNREYHDEVAKVWNKTVEEAFPDLAGLYPKGTKVATAYMEGVGTIRDRLDFGKFLERKAGRQATDAEDSSHQQAADSQSPEEVLLSEAGARIAKTAGLSSAEGERVAADMGWIGRYSKRLFQFYQLTAQNPDMVPYKESVQAYQAIRAQLRRMVIDVLDRVKKLGKQGTGRLANLTLTTTRMSFLEKRRLTQEEVNQLAVNLGVDADTLEVYHAQDAYFREVLSRIYRAMRVKIQQEWADAPEVIPSKVAELDEWFNEMGNRNYFPLKRFGKQVIVVRAGKTLERTETVGGKTYTVIYRGPYTTKEGVQVAGETVNFEAFETKAELAARKREVMREFPKEDYVVSVSELSEAEYTFQGFPPTLIDLFASRVGLDAEQVQKLKELRHEMAPGKSFVKHMMKRRSVLGFSYDLPRALADYGLQAAGFIARLEHADDMERTLREYTATTDRLDRAGLDVRKRVRVREWMRRHHAELLDPSRDFPAFRSFVTFWTFGYLPVMWVVNATQPMLVTTPWLANTLKTRLGDSRNAVVRAREASKAMNRAALDILKSYRWRRGFRPTEAVKYLTEEEQQAIARGVDDQFLAETSATELAAAAHGRILHRMLPISLLKRVAPSGVVESADRFIARITELGLRGFGIIEELNRFQSFLAAYRLARGQGLGSEAAYQYARECVDTTHLEYANFNRAEWMRGVRAPILQFLTYNLGMLYYAFMNPAGLSFLLMLLLMAGPMGLPFMEDIEWITSALLSQVRKWLGVKEPKISLEREAREFIQSLGTDPDLFLHGLSSGTMGHWVGQLLDWPVPKIDISTSLSMGRLLRGARPAVEAATGQIRGGTEAIMRLGEEVAGPGVAILTNMVRGILDPSVNGLWKLRMLVPRQFKTMALAYEGRTTGMIKDKSGAPLIHFDLNDKEHLAELGFMMFGFRPRDLNLMQQKHYFELSVMSFYDTWKASIVSQAAVARGAHPVDREALAEAQRERVRYNRMCPPGRTLTAGEFTSGINQKLRRQTRQQHGLPEVREWGPYLREKSKAWPARGQPPQR